MKNPLFSLGIGLISLLVGCSTTSVVLGPVGPDPVGAESMASTGSLEVFSRVAKQRDDQSQGGDGMPRWNQHTDYSIYNLQGKPVKHVENSTGHYAEAPKRVTLEHGLTTEIHLDGHWNPSTEVPKAKLLTTPNGSPGGWRAESTHALGIN
jgi:hypothetical protein